MISKTKKLKNKIFSIKFGNEISKKAKSNNLEIISGETKISLTIREAYALKELIDLLPKEDS